MLRARLLDVLVAAVCVVSAQLEIRHHGVDGLSGGPAWLNVTVLLVFGLLTVGWRVAPGPTLLAMSLTLFVPSLVTVHDTFFWTTMLPLVVVVYRNALSGDDPVARWGWIAPVLALLSDALYSSEVVSNLVTALVILGGGSLGGRLVRRHEQQRDRLDAALAELVAAQSEREQAAGQSERNRIATEMHDVMAHAVGEMLLQLGAARMGLQAARVVVPSQLAAAETTGRQALADLRRSLGVLPSHPEHGLTPVPGIAAIDRLVSGFRDAGLDVHLASEGDLQALPPGLQFAVHRVLQESLTNALKHAGPVRTDVCLARGRHATELEVVNARPQRRVPALPSGRHGLIGMRERVGVYGGVLVAGPTADGGWRLHARWPAPEHVGVAV